MLTSTLLSRLDQKEANVNENCLRYRTFSDSTIASTIESTSNEKSDLSISSMSPFGLEHVALLAAARIYLHKLSQTTDFQQTQKLHNELLKDISPFLQNCENGWHSLDHPTSFLIRTAELLIAQNHGIYDFPPYELLCENSFEIYWLLRKLSGLFKHSFGLQLFDVIINGLHNQDIAIESVRSLGSLQAGLSMLETKLEQSFKHHFSLQFRLKRIVESWEASELEQYISNLNKDLDFCSSRSIETTTPSMTSISTIYSPLSDQQRLSSIYADLLSGGTSSPKSDANIQDQLATSVSIQSLICLAQCKLLFLTAGKVLKYLRTNRIFIDNDSYESIKNGLVQIQRILEIDIDSN